MSFDRAETAARSPQRDDAHARSSEPAKLVRHFRQIVLWPLQLAPIREGAQIQEHWEVLARAGRGSPWGEVRDEFSGGPAAFKPRHYSEYTVMPQLRLTDQQALDLTEYLLNQKRTNTNPDAGWVVRSKPTL